MGFRGRLVTSADVAPDAIGPDALAPGAVGSEALADDSVTAAAIRNGQITPEHVDYLDASAITVGLYDPAAAAIQTDGTSGSILLDGAGLHLYDAPGLEGNRTVFLDADTGAGTFAGTITGGTASLGTIDIATSVHGQSAIAFSDDHGVIESVEIDGDRTLGIGGPGVAGDRYYSRPSWIALSEFSDGTDETKVSTGTFVIAGTVEAHGTAHMFGQAIDLNTAPDGQSDIIICDNVPTLEFWDNSTGKSSKLIGANQDLAFVGHGTGSDFRPGFDNEYGLGRSDARWQNVWAVDGTINTSDGRDKADVADDDLGLSFLLALRPRRWRWKHGTRPHYGVLADELRDVLAARGHDFAGFVDPEVGGRDGLLGLRPHEFIGPIIAAVQQIAGRLDALEGKEPT